MKQLVYIIIGILIPLNVFTEYSTEKVAKPVSLEEKSPYKIGEYLKYEVSYGFLTAGIAELNVKKSSIKINGEELYHMVGTGTSEGFFDWFFKVRDRYETHMFTNKPLPYYFVRRVDEGGYKINQDYIFDHQKKLVVDDKGKKFTVPENIQDMLSSFYFARNINFSLLKKGDIFTIPTFIDNEVYQMNIKYLGKETVKTSLGRFNCLKFAPIVQAGRVFNGEEVMEMWFTDDVNKIPVLLSAKVLVGSIKMTLVDYQGAQKPLVKL
jgi:hypothetical protein